MNKKEMEKKIKEHEKVLRQFLSCPMGPSYDELLEDFSDDAVVKQEFPPEEIVELHKGLVKASFIVSRIFKKFKDVIDYEWMHCEPTIKHPLQIRRNHLEDKYNNLPNYSFEDGDIPNMSLAEALLAMNKIVVDFDSFSSGKTSLMGDIQDEVQAFALCIGLELLKNPDKYETVDPCDPPDWECEEDFDEELDIDMGAYVKWGAIKVYEQPKHHLIEVEWAHLWSEPEEVNDIVKEWCEEEDDFFDARILTVDDKLFYLIEKES